MDYNLNYYNQFFNNKEFINYLNDFNLPFSQHNLILCSWLATILYKTKGIKEFSISTSNAIFINGHLKENYLKTQCQISIFNTRYQLYEYNIIKKGTHYSYKLNNPNFEFRNSRGLFNLIDDILSHIKTIIVNSSDNQTNIFKNYDEKLSFQFQKDKNDDEKFFEALNDLTPLIKFLKMKKFESSIQSKISKINNLKI